MSLKERKQLNAGDEDKQFYSHAFNLLYGIIFNRTGLLSGNKRGPAALAGNLGRSSPQQDDSSVTGNEASRSYTGTPNYFALIGKLKRRSKDGRALYLSGAKDGSAVISGVDMYASANSKRGVESGQGAR